MVEITEIPDHEWIRDMMTMVEQVFLCALYPDAELDLWTIGSLFEVLWLMDSTNDNRLALIPILRETTKQFNVSAEAHDAIFKLIGTFSGTL